MIKPAQKSEKTVAPGHTVHGHACQGWMPGHGGTHQPIKQRTERALEFKDDTLSLEGV